MANTMEWVAFFDFVPTDSRHIGLSKGDRILEVQHQGNGWAYGQNINTGQYGAFPSNYVESNLDMEVLPVRNLANDDTVQKETHIFGTKSKVSQNKDFKIESNKEQIETGKKLLHDLLKKPNDNRGQPINMNIKEKLESLVIAHPHNISESFIVSNSTTKNNVDDSLKSTELKVDNASESLSENTSTVPSSILINRERDEATKTTKTINNYETKESTNLKLPEKVRVHEKLSAQNKTNLSTQDYAEERTKLTMDGKCTSRIQDLANANFSISSTVLKSNVASNEVGNLNARASTMIVTSTARQSISTESLQPFNQPNLKSTDTFIVGQTVHSLYEDDNLTGAKSASSKNKINHVNDALVHSKRSSDQKMELNVIHSQITLKRRQHKTKPKPKKNRPKPKSYLSKKSNMLRTNLKTNATSGILGGLLAGGVLYILLVFNFSYSYVEAGWVTLPFTVLTGIGLALSKYVRCLFLLTIPQLFTGNGRAMFMTMIFGILINGPGVNILHNGNQMSKTIACTTELIKEQSQLLAKQLGEPILKVARRIREHFNVLKDMAHSIIEAIKPITKALHKVQEGFNKVTNALSSAYQKCDSGARNVLHKCKTGMSTTRRKCEEFIDKYDPSKHVVKATKQAVDWGKGAANFLVNIFKPKTQKRSVDTLRHRRAIADYACAILRADFVCDIFKLGKFVCKPLDAIAKVSRKATDAIFIAFQALTNLFVFDIETDFALSGGINTTKDASSIVSEVTNDLAKKTEIVLFVIGTFSKVMILSLLLLFIKSIFYINNYKSKDYYDNIYITTEFKKFDSACRTAGKATVLPLRRRELRKYVFTTSFSLSLIELQGSSQGIIVVVLHFMVTCLVMVFDYLIYYVLLLAKRYGQINISVTGVNVVRANVKGSGFIADFLRYLTAGLQIDDDFEVDFNETKCLPESREPNINYIFIFFALYFVAFNLICFQSYGMRLRRRIASYFYPEREFERILWLHEKIRHKRMTIFSWFLQQLKSKKKENDVSDRITLSSWFYYRCPKFATMCGGCEPTKVSCLACGITNDGLTQYHICQSHMCDAVYCMNCFKEMKNCCPKCKSKSKPSMTSSM